MNITFLIGNGYDMNLGLKTGYRDFLTWYLAQESPNDTIKAFKTLIDADIDTWSDLELTLGKQTLQAPLNEPASFRACKEDLDRALADYLRGENEKFTKNRLEEYTGQFQQSLIGFRQYCDEATKEKLDRIKQRHAGENTTYNIISFNFTNTVDVLWNELPDVLEETEYRKPDRKGDTWVDSLRKDWNTTTVRARKGKLIHLHGTKNDAMITGVDNSEQIANETLRTEVVEECFVKPTMNDNIGRNANTATAELIEKTDIFVVFGMSIGETDKRWWKRIAQRLAENPDSYLLLVNYDGEYNRQIAYAGRDTVREILNKFYRIAEISPELRKTLRQQVSVRLNTSMFKLKELDKYKKRRARIAWIKALLGNVAFQVFVVVCASVAGFVGLINLLIALSPPG